VKTRRPLINARLTAACALRMAALGVMTARVGIRAAEAAEGRKFLHPGERGA
jgi:hypothetical protein